MTTLHDEIAAEFGEHALASTGGYSLHEWTCITNVARWQSYEDERRGRREKDPVFAEAERARWKRANDRRAERKRAERERQVPCR